MQPSPRPSATDLPGTESGDFVVPADGSVAVRALGEKSATSHTENKPVTGPPREKMT